MSWREFTEDNGWGTLALIGAVAIIVIIVGLAAFFAGMNTGHVEITSITTTVTTTPAPPATIQIGGTFGTSTTGTSASSIQFVSQTSGISYPAQTSGNGYSISLPNRASYTVKIHWADVLNIRSGDCVAGNLPLFLQFTPNVTSQYNWSC